MSPLRFNRSDRNERKRKKRKKREFTMKHQASDLYQMQALPLDIKIKMTEFRIREWYNHYGGEVYCSFSGGKDSTVLLDIIRNTVGVYDVPAVFVDTGLEYPEIKAFVKSVHVLNLCLFGLSKMCLNIFIRIKFLMPMKYTEIFVRINLGNIIQQKHRELDVYFVCLDATLKKNQIGFSDWLNHILNCINIA